MSSSRTRVRTSKGGQAHETLEEFLREKSRAARSRSDCDVEVPDTRRGANLQGHAEPGERRRNAFRTRAGRAPALGNPVRVIRFTGMGGKAAVPSTNFRRELGGEAMLEKTAATRQRDRIDHAAVVVRGEHNSFNQCGSPASHHAHDDRRSGGVWTARCTTVSRPNTRGGAFAQCQRVDRPGQPSAVIATSRTHQWSCKGFSFASAALRSNLTTRPALDEHACRDHQGRRPFAVTDHARPRALRNHVDVRLPLVGIPRGGRVAATRGRAGVLPSTQSTETHALTAAVRA